MANEIILNGIDGSTGDYYTPPLSDFVAISYLSGHAEKPETMNLLRSLYRDSTQPHLGLPWNRDPKSLKDSGWGIVFHENETNEVKTALHRLIQHRRDQIGDPQVVKVLDYRNGETVLGWLARHRVAPGTVEPVGGVPFYLLLVGRPDLIPFEFSNLLTVEYCLGRLDLDTPENYAHYAESIIAYETSPVPSTSREVVFWAPRQQNEGDPTKTSADYVVKPLAEGNDGQPSLVDRVSSRTGVQFTTRYFAPDASTKPNLMSIFSPAPGTSTPAFVFTASHGLGWPLGHPQQATATGALVCQEFPGRGQGTLRPEHYFTAADLPSDARVHGMVAFHFACFGAGCPQFDRFVHLPFQPPPQIAPAPFFSALPKALLTHRNGGALAVIGHTERAWLTSLAPSGAGVQLLPFENAIAWTLSGLPLGYAIRTFNERYAALSTNLASLLEQKEFGMLVSDAELVLKWRDRNDAESYILFGDPGVRIRVETLR